MSTPRELVAQMTLEEKCSLLSGLDFWHTKSVERLGIRGVMYSDGPHGLRKQDDQGDHLGVNDSIKAVCFPAACASTASFDRNLVRQIGEAVGNECQHEQVAVNLGPAINIKRSPLCGRNFEYMSEDPYLAGEMAVGIIQGTQSKNIGVSVKHFAANDQEHRRMSSDSVVDERTLREIYLPAFEAAAKRGKAWTFMCSYNKLNGEYASQHKWLLTDLLRNEWGFDGIVMSDWGAVSDRVKGVEAGLDMEMPSSAGVNDAEVVKAVREGRLDEKYVDLCCERIIEVHNRYLEHADPSTPWDKEADHELAGKLGADCMVLLKNDDGILPLKDGEKIAIIGEFANKPRYQGGGSSHINSFKVTSLLNAVEDKPGACVCYAQGYHIDSDDEDAALVAEALEKAKAADKVVVVAGLPDNYESEGYDRKHMRIPPNQNALIEKVAAVNPNLVVLLYNGSPVEMPWLGLAKGLIEGYLGGQNVGTANRAVLWGEVNPSARLPETMPVKLQDTPCYLSYGGEGNTAVYSEGIFVGYRYYTKKEMPVLFPFGYGMSYTTFAYDNLRLSAGQIEDTDTVTVCVDVTNTGKVAGKEVVQLYVSDRESEVFRPVRELKGFDKIELQPGETRTVTFTLDKRSFAYWNTKIHDWHVETGVFDIQICKDADTVILSAPLTVESTVEIPETFTEDSITLDIRKNPKAMAILSGLLKGGLSAIFGDDKPETSDAASEAVGDEMMEAMMAYMPLRGLISFSQGKIDHEVLKGLLDRMNG
ncbi:MAG: glycoside hydrolase family 3 C-terminal domain-containing protein [Clostridia bacterium]|nr:glycoside hydrolase family 3 C-terminal domain-containing protein [Clostridia bacterium]